MEKLTQEEVEFLEKYVKINGLMLRVESLETDIDLVDNDDELNKLKEEFSEVENELSSEFKDWTRRLDTLNYNIENKQIIDQRDLDMQEFYNDNIRGYY